jgi:hypothetical protein
VLEVTNGGEVFHVERVVTDPAIKDLELEDAIDLWGDFFSLVVSFSYKIRFPDLILASGVIMS